ncbi:WhiB family transcriptional regulator [Nonomuraea sp. NPDC049400]|uniref:WhiB family transcriptional regulator n=1 Tax=Nonomuraea sp. NPDC049400 TaxID=3364352 RepID=UPI0037A41965
MATPDWSWQKRAACHGQSLALFFGMDGERGELRDLREQKAKEVCAQCPVKLFCRETAFILKMDAGVWGGLGEDERRSKRRAWVRRGSQQGVGAA